MFAVINTMDRSDRVIGRIVSRHRTVETATAADSKLQRAVRRRNGPTSYLPTIVCQQVLESQFQTTHGTRGSWAYRSDWVQVDQYTGEPVES